MPLSQIQKGTTETSNYAVEVVHFTKPESINNPVNVAFELTDPTTCEGIIQMPAHRWTCTTGLSRTGFCTPRERRCARRARSPCVGPSLRN